MQAFNHLHQRLIAHTVTVSIIDRLEIIDIHGDQRQRQAKALGAVALFQQHFFKAVAIGDQSQGIPFGQGAVFIQLQLQLLIDP